ncbi:MAG: Sulfoxide reductase heme-binding subunit YedZ [Pseudorhodoplanes sp.]|nr:Sulfoxide reductase heme-binding subunit YedZ [Pseudorhodoplanes sp.]GIK78908.1 MAG: hypothetical protein BroJett024_00130 [Alphaproteobacteria bacterium]
MSVGFRAVQWNRDKLIYDAVLLAVVAAFIVSFIAIEAHLHPPKDGPAWIDLRIRAFGLCAFLMLTAILSIGPLARLSPRFLPLLYNRRHFGVLTFVIAALHASFMVEWYAVQNTLPNIVTELTTWTDYGRFIGFPFKALGLGALLILLLLASTSHDYWLQFLSPPVWKALHMLVYGAYGLAVMHVALGAMQSNRHPAIPVLLAASLCLVAGLHLVAGWRERGCHRRRAGADGWIAVGPPDSIPDKCARIVNAPGGERIAVFRDGDRVGAVTNLCAHQNGPLGEGRIIDGCITCPWHGYQYRLDDGCAPPPFTERLATYRVRIARGIVEVDPRALAPGTPAAISISS